MPYGVNGFNPDEEDDVMPVADTQAEAQALPLDGGQVAAPASMPQPLSAPPRPANLDQSGAPNVAGAAQTNPADKSDYGNDAIRQFLIAKLKSNGGEVDPKLQQARFMESIDRATNASGRAMGNAGDAIVHNARAFANAIAGHGFQAEETPASAKIQPYDESASPVHQYLAAKRAQQEAASADAAQVKEVLAAQKALNGKDADGVEAGKLKLGQDSLAFRKDSFERQFPMKEHDSQRKDDKLDLDRLKREDLEKFRKYQESIGWSRLGSQDKTRALAQYKAEQQDKRIAQRQEGLDRDAIDRGVVGADGITSKANAKDLTAMSGNTAAAVGMLGRLKELRSELTLNGALPTDKEAEFESLYHALSPVLNGAEFKTAWNGQHRDNFKEQIRSPQDLRNWLNKDYFDKQVDEVIGALSGNYKTRAAAAGIKVRSDVPGQDTGRGGDPAHAPGKAGGVQITPAQPVRMIGPKGEVGTVPAAKVKAAKLAGWREA